MKTGKKLLAAFLTATAITTGSAGVLRAEEGQPAAPQAQAGEAQAPAQAVKELKYIEYGGLNAKYGSVKEMDFIKEQICEGFYSLEQVGKAAQAQDVATMISPSFESGECKSFKDVTDPLAQLEIYHRYVQVLEDPNPIVININKDDINEKAEPGWQSNPKTRQFGL